jgi:hypothetical protein
MYTSQIIIRDSDLYQVTSLGRGAAYSIERKSDGASLLLQGNEAKCFRDEWHKYENAGISVDEMIAEYDCAFSEANRQS